MAELIDLSKLLPEARSFLTELSENNTRDWFQTNKLRYDIGLKRPAERLMSLVTTSLAQTEGAEVKAKLFRPHRDVRFSEDKTPYHAHLHILWFLPDGRGWFLGIAPDYATAGSGMMAFEKEQIEHWRAAVATAPGDALAAILEGSGWRMDEPQLKRVPSDYPADHPHAALLRRKGLVVWQDALEDALTRDPQSALTEVFASQKPVTDWLAKHVGTA